MKGLLVQGCYDVIYDNWQQQLKLHIVAKSHYGSVVTGPFYQKSHSEYFCDKNILFRDETFHHSCYIVCRYFEK
jgi:hypothetical protein